MEEKKTPEAVPFFVYEGEMARNERHVRRLWVALIIAILCIVLVAAGFLLYLNQYDFASYEQDGEGVNIIGSRNGVDFNVPTSSAAYQEEPLFGIWPGDAEAQEVTGE